MNPYFYSPYKILNKSVLCVLLVFGFSLIFLAFKQEVAVAWNERFLAQKIISLIKQNNLEGAMEATDKFIHKYKKKKRDDLLGWGYNTKGVIFTAMNEYTKAIYAYEESIKYKGIDRNNDNSITLGNIGGLQHRLGDYTGKN